MNFSIRRLTKEIFQATVLIFRDLLGEIEICRKCKISAQYLQNCPKNTITWGVNTL